MSLQDLLDKCKSDRFFVTALVFLVGIGSYGLGRLSKIEETRPNLSIEAPKNVANALASLYENVASSSTKVSDPEGSEQGGEVVASKSGTKYHFPWCSGAKSIDDKNKIWFNSIAEARKAGYTPASNCKGLK